MRLVLCVIAAACAAFLYIRGDVLDISGKHRMGALTLNSISLSGDEAAPFEITETRDGVFWIIEKNYGRHLTRNQELSRAGVWAGLVMYAIHETREAAMKAARFDYRRVATRLTEGLWGEADRVVGDACWSSKGSNGTLLVVRRNCCLLVGIHADRIGETDPKKAMYEARRLTVLLACRIVAKIDSSWLW